MTRLVDSSVLIDALNDRNRRPEFLVSLGECGMGMRPSEAPRTERFLRSLVFYPVTWEIAQLAGRGRADAQTRAPDR